MGVGDGRKGFVLFGIGILSRVVVRMVVEISMVVIRRREG